MNTKELLLKALAQAEHDQQNIDKLKTQLTELTDGVGNAHNAKHALDKLNRRVSELEATLAEFTALLGCDNHGNALKKLRSVLATAPEAIDQHRRVLLASYLETSTVRTAIGETAQAELVMAARDSELLISETLAEEAMLSVAANKTDRDIMVLVAPALSSVLFGSELAASEGDNYFVWSHIISDHEKLFSALRSGGVCAVLEQVEDLTQC